MEEVKEEILPLTPEEARKKGVKHRSTLKRMKDRINKKGTINLKTKAVKKLLNAK